MACSTKASNSASLRLATSRSLLKWRGAGIRGDEPHHGRWRVRRAISAAEELWIWAGVRSWSSRFGGGDGKGVIAEASDEGAVAEAGNQVEPFAERLDVAAMASMVATSQRSICDTRLGVTPMALASWAWVRPWRLQPSARRYRLCRTMGIGIRCLRSSSVC